MHHLELEENHLMASKRKFHGRNHQEIQVNAQVKKKQKFNQLKKGKKKGFFKKKKHVSKPKCYNYVKKGHFACDYKEPKKVNDLYALVSAINVSSYVFFIESYPLWTVDFGATNHVEKDILAFLESRRILKRTKWIYVGTRELK